MKKSAASRFSSSHCLRFKTHTLAIFKLPVRTCVLRFSLVKATDQWLKLFTVHDTHTTVTTHIETPHFTFKSWTNFRTGSRLISYILTVEKQYSIILISTADVRSCCVSAIRRCFVMCMSTIWGVYKHTHTHTHLLTEIYLFVFLLACRGVCVCTNSFCVTLLHVQLHFVWFFDLCDFPSVSFACVAFF